MAALKNGETIELQNGGKLKVISLLGEGGQGYVYEVEYESHKYALKWYKTSTDWMYTNIGRLIEKGPPSKDFLWPELLTSRKSNGDFGYVMKLRPPEFKDIIRGRRVIDFNQCDNPVLLRIIAALKICSAFKILHAEGLIYHDINDGGFFINPENGQVMICDCDNVTPDGARAKVDGKMRYMAPEIVVGQSHPNKRTDYFSLSVILFLLFYGNHPLEGSGTLKYPCYTPAIEKEVYGKNPVFIVDPTNSSNRPDQNIHRNVLIWWPFYPSVLREAFIKAFSKEVIANPQKRMRETEWIEVLTKVRDLLVKCSCGEEIFARKECICCFCKNHLTIPFKLQMGTKKIPCTSKKYLYSSHTVVGGDIFEAVGQIVRNKTSNQMGLKNLSKKQWAVEKNGRINKINTNELIILSEGMKVHFSNDVIGVIS